MTRFVTEQTIARSADEVWAYAADIARHPEWMAVTDARVLTGRERPERAGGSGCGSARSSGTSSSRSRTRRPDVGSSGRRSLARRSISSVALDLEPVDLASTKATYGADIRLHGLWRLLGPMVAMEAKAGPERELKRLKAPSRGGVKPRRQRCHDGVE